MKFVNRLASRLLYASLLAFMLASGAHAQDAEAPVDPAAQQATSTEVPADAATAGAAAPATVDTIPVAEAEVPAAAAGKEEPQGGNRLDAVDVTGSRLKRVDYEGAQPVTVIGREDIVRSGLTNIGDLLGKIAAAGATVNTTFATLALSGGETNLDLRNLGANRVLVLVNGHRWVNGLNSTGTSTVDLNNIPVAVIERIEVLKDGASAIYGSDAIAGVVNIITRKNLEGVEFSSQYGLYEQGDGARQQHEISFGKSFAQTNIFANLSYAQEASVKTTTREISAYPVVGAGSNRLSSFGPNGLFQFVPNPQNGLLNNCPNLVGDLANGALADPSGTAGVPLPGGLIPPVQVPGQVSTIPAGLQLCKLVYDPNDPSLTNDYRAYEADRDGYNRYTDSNLQNPSRRGALFVQVNQQIFDNLTLNFEGLYNNRRSESQLRPQALLVGDLAGSDIFVSSSNRYNPFNQDIGKGDPVLTDQLGVGIGSGAAGIRLTEKFPAVITTQNYDTLRLGAALNGNFDLFTHNFAWDGGYGYSSNKRKQLTTGDYRKDRLKLALGPDSECTGDCVAFNIFEGQAGITQEMVDYIAIYAHNSTRSRQDDFFLNLSTDLGPLQLPAGPIAVAAGLEYRRDEYTDEPDAILQAGLSSGNNSVRTEGKDSVREAYFELGVPLLKDVPGFQELELSLAGRRSEYQRFDATDTAKVGLRWKVYEDLLLRGTYSTAFRAPNVGELFLGDSDSFDSVDDPCASDRRNDPTTGANCDADGVPANVTQQEQVVAIYGGNVDLKPETAKTATYGFVFNPGFVPNLSLNADFYSIRLKNYITNPGSQFILDSCYTADQRSLCEYVHRNPNGTLDYIEARLVNYAALNTSGIDFGVNYLLPVQPEYGQFKIDTDASYLIQYDQVLPLPGGGTTTVGSVGSSGGFVGIPRWKANGTLTWKLEDLTLSWHTRLVYTQNESCVDGLTPSLAEMGLCSNPKTQNNADGTTTDVSENTLKTVFYHDARVGFDFGGTGLSLALGVNNILDQDPPQSFSPSAGGAYFNYDVLQYEIPGRFFYMRAGLKF